MKASATTAPPVARPSTGAVNKLGPYVFHARWAVALTSPFLYACVVPFALLDLFASVFQAVCFPVYGIPKVRRGEYFIYDRARLPYLNALERINCYYCSYANGLAAYVGEIAARTEQYWCPIQHASDPKAPHSRYPHFLRYGDADEYRERGADVSKKFDDVQPPRD